MKRLIIIMGMLCNNLSFSNPVLNYEEAVIAFKQTYFINAKKKLLSKELTPYTSIIVNGLSAIKTCDQQEKKDHALQYLVDIYYQQPTLYSTIKIAIQKVILYGANPNLDMVEKKRDRYTHIIDYKNTPMLIAICENDDELRDFLLVHGVKHIDA